MEIRRAERSDIPELKRLLLLVGAMHYEKMGMSPRSITMDRKLEERSC